MQRFMLGVDALLRRRRRLFLGLWLVAILAALPFAAQREEELTGGGWEAGGSESLEVRKAIEREFPGARVARIFVVAIPRDGATPADLRDAVDGIAEGLRDKERVELTAAGRERALERVASAPDEPLVIPLPTKGGEAGAVDSARELRDEFGIEGDDPGTLAGGKVSVHIAGIGALWASFQDVNNRDVQKAEGRGFPIIALILLGAFGSLAAAALPLSLGAVTLIITGALIYALSVVSEISVFVIGISSLVGLGVAVDYSLFVLARYREEVTKGRTPEQARAVALATSGVAVTFSGLTVMVSIAALFLIDSTGIQSIGLGAIVVVAVSILAASLLLPLMISLLGRRAHEPGRIGRALERRSERRRAADAEGRGFWERWTARIMGRPILYALAATAALLLLAAPALELSLKNTATSQLDEQNEARVGTAAAASVVGPGALGPTLVVVEFDTGAASDAANERVLDQVVAALRSDPGVAEVEPPSISEDGDAAQLTVTPRGDPESSDARDTVERLRAELPEVTGGAAQVKVGGATATGLDFDELMSDSLWKLILFVLAASFVVLVVLLRSIVLPIKAVLMNILSVLAAYGVLVAAFQWGWLEFLGVDKQDSINTGTPPIVLVIAFGLSMDYEIFLLTRIRERYAVTRDNAKAVAEGLASSAHTITSAALIMVAVFISFVSAGVPSAKEIGLACAVAIGVDATIVRLVLVPSMMKLLGDWNWWLPKPLARILPVANLDELQNTLDPRLASMPELAAMGANGGPGADGAASGNGEPERSGQPDELTR